RRASIACLRLATSPLAEVAETAARARTSGKSRQRRIGRDFVRPAGVPAREGGYCGVGGGLGAGVGSGTCAGPGGSDGSGVGSGTGTGCGAGLGSGNGSGDGAGGSTCVGCTWSCAR